MLYSKAVHVAVVQLCSCSYIFVQLLDPGVECAKYSKELSKVLSSDPVQKMEQRNKVIDISFMLTYMWFLGKYYSVCADCLKSLIEMHYAMNSLKANMHYLYIRAVYMGRMYG